jgi:opacity protein-like surface antigen
MLSVVTVAALCSVVSAEELQSYNAEEYNENAPEDKGIYVGLGYSRLSLDIDPAGTTYEAEIDYHSLLLEVGYKFNPYIAVEANYIFSISESFKDGPGGDLDESVFGLYVKPMYPIAPEMDIYAMLGYALTNIDDSKHLHDIDEGSFSLGAGASYQITEDFSIFAEYMRFYSGTVNISDYVFDTYNIGLGYRF